MDTIKRQLPVQTLNYPDLFFFQAAEGWLELGDAGEALHELDQIAQDQCSYADVLHLRWRILVGIKQWDRCVMIARVLTQLYPREARNWIALAETYYLMGEVQKAYKVAAANAAEFSESWNLLYDAACYACLVGKFDQAKRFFQMAMRVGDAKSIRLLASQDPNLKQLWRDSARTSRKQNKI